MGENAGFHRGCFENMSGFAENLRIDLQKLATILQAIFEC